jgi:drug/metabolite transporter (DMT)-like permease
VSEQPAESGLLDLVHRPMPPVAQIGMASMALIVGGGIYLAANLPHHVSLIPAVVLLLVAAALAAVNGALLARLKQFAWPRFVQVAVRMFAAYIVIAGMIEYAFVLDHTPGKVIGVITLMLVVFAVDIPVILGFTVARYSDPRGGD